jgi:hypothetical protein
MLIRWGRKHCIGPIDLELDLLRRMRMARICASGGNYAD